MEEEDYEGEEYEIEVLEDFSEPFDSLKKWAQKIPSKYKSWRVELSGSEIILYKLDISKGAARTPVTIQIIQKDSLEVNFYAGETLLDFQDLNKLIGIDLKRFTCKNINQMVEFLDEHTFIKGDISQLKVLDEPEKHNNLALFYSKNVQICRFCFNVEGKSDPPFHEYTDDLQSVFEELTLLNTKHKKAPNRICLKCTEQLLSSHEARVNFIAADRMLEECTQVVLITDTDGVKSTNKYLQVKPGTLISSSSSDEGLKRKRGPSILKSRAKKPANMT